MFWRAFRWGKLGPGLFFEVEKGKHINAAMYRNQILAGPLYDFWTESFLEVTNSLVMEDGALIHKGVAKKFREESGMLVHEHSPNSPDLNPIENIWAWVKYRLAKDYAYLTSEAELRKVVKELWNSIPTDYLNNLVESMPDRIEATIKAKGGSMCF
jgi:transposase